MRTFLLFICICSCLYVFSQKPVEGKDSIAVGGEPTLSSDNIFDVFVLDKPPVFPGGDKDLLKFLAANIYWPKGCGDVEIVGRIVVQFIIDTTGDWSEFKILKTPGKCFEPVVAEIFAKMPCWEPGELEGNKVQTRMTLPIQIHWE